MVWLRYEDVLEHVLPACVLMPPSFLSKIAFFKDKKNKTLPHRSIEVSIGSDDRQNFMKTHVFGLGPPLAPKCKQRLESGQDLSGRADIPVPKLVISPMGLLRTPWGGRHPGLA
jgi:hypothetical protein